MADFEMKRTMNRTNVERVDPKPMKIVGAGRLIATIWKLGGEHTVWRYRFNLVRQTSDSGIVSDLFQPTDLIHFIKLIQLLAAVIADDGCLTQGERTTLRNLAAQLDDLLGGATVEMDVSAAPTT